MPSRLNTFFQVLPVIARQVDRMFVFLDGFERVPSFLQDISHVTVIRSQDAGNYHAAGRFLCLQELTEPSVLLSFDDDIHYPHNYVKRLVEALTSFEGRAVVGVHGIRFRPPYRDYVKDHENVYFGSGLWRMKRVDQLGAGTAAFCTDQLYFDVKNWKAFRSNDTCLALEAKRRDLPLWCIPRKKRWLQAYKDPQEFSIWAEAQKDPSEKTALMRQLLSERVAEFDTRAKGKT